MAGELSGSGAAGGLARSRRVGATGAGIRVGADGRGLRTARTTSSRRHRRRHDSDSVRELRRKTWRRASTWRPTPVVAQRRGDRGRKVTAEAREELASSRRRCRCLGTHGSCVAGGEAFRASIDLGRGSCRIEAARTRASGRLTVMDRRDRVDQRSVGAASRHRARLRARWSRATFSIRKAPGLTAPRVEPRRPSHRLPGLSVWRRLVRARPQPGLIRDSTGR